MYSEKATKFYKIFTLLLSYVVPVKSKVKILQNFVPSQNIWTLKQWKTKHQPIHDFRLLKLMINCLHLASMEKPINLYIFSLYYNSTANKTPILSASVSKA